MNEEKKIRKTFLFSPSLVQMIKELQDKTKQNSATAVVIEAINTLNRKINPSYVTQRTLTVAKTPEDRAEQQMEIARIKKEKEEEVLLDIANRLEGHVTINESGHKTVRFFNYDKGRRDEQTLPLRMMNEELVKDQYYPSREEVEKRQAEGKTTYKVGSWE